ncbi:MULTISPECIES: oxidoreductase [unclassified Aeromicrobium]|jgi:NAD(P)-dependent dehydrogenase (short-subunit alcohol dehydrogenase family)|uniref:oxidoreductase n=1 Tax=unclassified Aeromicrobium TaxID=2633570 RepID=UPI000B325BB4|nr:MULTISPECIES: oxidoreductase [unclassified Aeromicrobium]
MSWSTQDIPDLGGKRAVVTGVTGGLGFHTALELGRAGAGLTVTARNPQKADDTLARLREELPDVDVEVLSLDLADLADVRRAVEELGSRHDRVDVLVNNAGIMIPPYSTTADGFELQIGTNHVGHFAWTAQVWPLLADDARVVSVSSLAHLQAKGIDLRSLTPEGSPRTYRRWVSYAESKLANLSFALELDRRLKSAGKAVVSTAAHPGFARTELQKTGVAMGNPFLGTVVQQVSALASQSAAAGALPSLRAATDPTFTGGEYVGPASLGGTRGAPVIAGMTRWARDEQLARDLWAATEQATGVTFEV